MWPADQRGRADVHVGEFSVIRKVRGDIALGYPVGRARVFPVDRGRLLFLFEKWSSKGRINANDVDPPLVVKFNPTLPPVLQCNLCLCTDFVALFPGVQGDGFHEPGQLSPQLDPELVYLFLILGFLQ